ncbi:MAG: class I SAM-dependent DNA methyltransferase [Myxococcota bacterium]
MHTDEQTLYRRCAHLYDRIYHWKDYAKEAEVVHGLLRGAGVREGARVVEAACGTGSYLVHLNNWYEVSGFDCNPATLEVARKKVPGVELFQGDMTGFELKRPVDAIVCLFSSIGYVALGEPLCAVAESFYRNVLPGGTVLVEPWIEPEAAIDGHLAQQTYASDTLKLCRAGVHRVDGRRSSLSFHWLVTTIEGVEHFVDDHTLWMSTRAEMMAVFEAAGFETRWSDEGLMPDRGVLIATRGR